MNPIEIARRMAVLGQKESAIPAYILALHQGCEPAERMEAAVYILQNGGDYKISYTVFVDLYRQGHFREDILSLLEKVFYEPNIKLLRGRYKRNCKLLGKYPYLFRKDFLPFEDLPIRFFPFDDHNGYIPFHVAEQSFGDFVNFRDTVISRNFFKDLENPVLAEDVYSQYELEYLNDNVRRSEDVGRENHVYLHYSDWGAFCAHLQCLNLSALLEQKKFVFLIGDEIGQYPIDFKERFGIDYSSYPVRPIRVREVNKLIWHTQLSTHNGGDFFNEVFDNHPNLLAMPSVMMSDTEETAKKLEDAMAQAVSLGHAMEIFKEWASPQIIEELYWLRDRTTKDFLVAMFLNSDLATTGIDPNARISPAVFFQPHFHNITYTMAVDQKNNTVLDAPSYEEIRKSPLFRGFKYIKTFTPIRRFTTSHGATVKFMYQSALAAVKAEEMDESKSKTVVTDAVSERILNRSFMVDPEDRLYHDSIVVRLEDGKLNPKATFTALAAFLDLPYTETMTYCSEGGKKVPYLGGEYAPGFNPEPIYRTYDEYVNDSERYFIEYFLRDAYAYYGYDFQWYDRKPVDMERVKDLVSGFTTMNHYLRETWRKVFSLMKISSDKGSLGSELEDAIREQMLENHLKQFNEKRIRNAEYLLGGLRFVNKNGQPLYMTPMLKLDPALLEQPLYH